MECHTYFKMKFSSGAFVEPWRLWREWVLRTNWRNWVHLYLVFVKVLLTKRICSIGLHINVFVIKVCSSLMYMLEDGTICVWMIRQNTYIHICIVLTSSPLQGVCLMHDEFTSIFTNVFTALTVNHEIKPEVMNFSFGWPHRFEHILLFKNTFT